MFRKTHFEPKKALINEIVSEFSVYFYRFGRMIRRICERYPKPIFFSMLASILISGILAFTIMRVKKAEPLTVRLSTAPKMADGFGQILDAGQSLKKVLDLQNQVNIILHKDSLTGEDSLLVKNAINQLETIHRQLNAK